MAVWMAEKTPGTWWVFRKSRAPDGTLIRKSKRCKSKKAAEKFAEQLQAVETALKLGLAMPQQTEATVEPEAPKGPTFGDYADVYLAKVEPDPKDPTHGLKHSTHRDYGQCIKNRLKPALGDRLLSSLCRRDIKQLVTDLKAAGLSSVNVRKHVRVLSTVLSEAVEDELLEHNPAMQLRKLNRSKLQQVNKRKIEVLSEAELAHVLKTALAHSKVRGSEVVHPYRPYHPFLLTLADSGLRLGEALGLQWGDVDFHGGFLHVQRAFSRGRLDKPKNGKDRRVYITAEMVEALRALYRERFDKVAQLDPNAEAKRKAEQAEAIANAWVFATGEGGALDEYNVRKRVWMPLLQTAELKHYPLKSLRHGYASRLIACGKNPKFIQAQLGHHNAAFTLDVYGHLMPGEHEGLVDLRRPVTQVTQGTPGTATASDAHAPQTEKPLVSQGVF